MSRRVVRREIWKRANNRRGPFWSLWLLFAVGLFLVWLLQLIAGR